MLLGGVKNYHVQSLRYLQHTGVRIFKHFTWPQSHESETSQKRVFSSIRVNMQIRRKLWMMWKNPGTEAEDLSLFGATQSAVSGQTSSHLWASLATVRCWAEIVLHYECRSESLAQKLWRDNMPRPEAASKLSNQATWRNALGSSSDYSATAPCSLGDPGFFLTGSLCEIIFNVF